MRGGVRSAKNVPAIEACRGDSFDGVKVNLWPGLGMTHEHLLRLMGGGGWVGGWALATGVRGGRQVKLKLREC